MRANWFIGLPVISDGWFARLSPPPPGFRLFAPSDLHFTIAFLGPVDEPAARSAFAALVWPLHAIDATLGAVVPMGPPARYSALSALLVEGRGVVEQAIGSSRDAAYEAAEVALDARPAKAHLTLARPQRRASADERARGLVWANDLTLTGTPVRIGAPALFTWAFDRGQTLFRIVETA